MSEWLTSCVDVVVELRWVIGVPAVLALVAVLDVRHRANTARWQRFAIALEHENDDLRDQLRHHAEHETVSAYSCVHCGARIGVAGADPAAIVAYRGDVEWHQTAMCQVEPLRPATKRLRAVRGEVQ